MDRLDKYHVLMPLLCLSRNLIYFYTYALAWTYVRTSDVEAVEDVCFRFQLRINLIASEFAFTFLSHVL